MKQTTIFDECDSDILDEYLEEGGGEEFEPDTPLGSQGQFCMINKNMLMVDKAYQRNILSKTDKIRFISKNFSWFTFGVLKVSKRGEDYYVVDGQHRLMAALAREDVSMVPCYVFAGKKQSSEAGEFLDCNTTVSYVDSVDRHRAGVIANREVNVKVQSILDRCGLRLAKAPENYKEIRCIGWLLTHAPKNYDRCEKLLVLAKSLYEDRAESNYITTFLMSGLHYLEMHMVGGVLTNKKFISRMEIFGGQRLAAEAHNAITVYGSGGPRVHAMGIMDLTNRRLVKRTRFKLRTNIYD